MMTSLFKVAGYVGGIHRWLDEELIEYVAGHFPNIEFRFVGPAQCVVPTLYDIPNITFPGRCSLEELPAVISAFDVCLIPYLICPYTHASYPIKVLQYLAAGKPVVATRTRELARRFGDVLYLAEYLDQFRDALRTALEENSIKKRVDRISVASKYRWRHLIPKMTAPIERALCTG